MDRLTALIDKYLVPVYKNGGMAELLLLLAFLVGVVALALYFGLGDLLKGFIQ